MELAYRIVTFVALLLAARGIRWAYALFVLLALLSFPMRAGFEIAPQSCEGLVGLELALFSFRNFPHIILSGLFFLLSRAQFKGRHASIYAFVATLVMGALLELAQGLSGDGHCRLRDLLPDAAGATLGWLTFVTGRRVYQRLFVKPV